MSGPIPSLALPTAALSAKVPTAAAASASPTDPKLTKVAKQFESLFVRQMLAAAHKANFGDTLFSSQAGDTFRDMQDQRFADISAQKGSFGMARMIEKQLSHQSQITKPAAPAATSKTGG